MPPSSPCLHPRYFSGPDAHIYGTQIHCIPTPDPASKYLFCSLQDDALVGSFEPPSSNDKDIYAQLENCGSKSIKRSDLQ